SGLQARDAGAQRQDRALGFLTSAGQIRSILALPARALQGSAGLYVAAHASHVTANFSQSTTQPLDRA
ncbi:MAG: hypothetical protein LBF06_01615, partial [Pseudomonas sp.]|nr:hypothetical protein [Pseudomonas sp.]